MRAELFSSDFLISFFIFLSAFIILTTYYQNLQTDVYETNARNDMYSKAISVASLLSTSSGYPQYWDNNTVQVIGLYDSGRFNLTKFEYLKNISYSKVRTMLGTGAYNFNITLINTTGNIIEKSIPPIQYSYGTPFDNAEQVVLVKRLGVVNLNGNTTKVTLEVILWE